MNTVNISPRLMCVANAVPPCKTLADIGTDHGLLPIYLVLSGKVQRAVASDLRKGPLNQARENVRLHKLTGKIELHLRSGLDGIEPHGVDVAVIAGMGGDLISSIIAANPDAADTYVLQSMSRLDVLRANLQNSGFKIVSEALCAEGEHIYTVMRVIRGVQCWNAHELVFSPLLHNDPLYGRFLQSRLLKLRRNFEQIKNSENSAVTDAFYDKIKQTEDEISVCSKEQGYK